MNSVSKLKVESETVSTDNVNNPLKFARADPICPPLIITRWDRPRQKGLCSPAQGIH